MKLPNNMGDLLAPHVFVGDETFPLRCDLLRPISRNALANDASIFNYWLSHGRRVEETSFGILVNCWRLHHRHTYLNPYNVTTGIKATLVLHNILTIPNYNIWNEVLEDHVQVFDDAFEDLTKQGNRPTITAAAQVCTFFTEYICSVNGAVDLQHETAHVI